MLRTPARSHVARVIGSRHRARIVAGAAAAAACLAVPAAAHAATLHATPSSLSSAFASARPGDTIALASGDYGTFSGGRKSGTVTLVPESGATPTLKASFNSATNITLDGLKLSGLTISGSGTKNITVRNSDFTGAQAVIRTSDLVDANVLLDHDRFVGYSKCSSCYEGRIDLPGNNSSGPSGVTISNSYFSGGESDGIQNGGNGVRIIGNEFANIVDDPNLGAHVDAVQLYGSTNTLIKGNWFHNTSNGVVAFDGADHETIEDNVIDTSVAITLVSDDGSIVRHNTLTGNMRLGYKSEYPGGRGTVIEDNVFRTFDNASSSNSYSAEDYNLIATGGRGPHDITGTPTFVGGSRPSTYSGYALAAGSLGKGDASDGLDRGVRFGSPSPTPTPSSSPSPSPSPGSPAPVASWTYSPSWPRINRPVTLDGTKSTGDALSCLWDFDGYETRTGCRIYFTFKHRGRKHITLTVTDSAGRRSSLARTIRVH